MVPDFGKLAAVYQEKEEKFRAFTELLLFYNGKFNLTSITGEEDIYIKHYLDSLAGESFFPERAHAADVGAGAGFPSIPLCIAREDLTFTLIESTRKKCEFLRTAVKELSLRAEVVCMRAEDAGRGPLRETFDVCCARAVAAMNTLAEYCLPLVAVGGRMVAYKGTGETLSDAQHAVTLLGGGKLTAVGYDLPKGYGSRVIAVSEKERKTPQKYPRGQGAERRDPLV